MPTVADLSQEFESLEKDKARYRELRSLTLETTGVRTLCLLVFGAVAFLADLGLSWVGAISAGSFGILTIGAIALQIGISLWAVALDLVAWPVYALTRSEDLSFVVGLAVGVAPAIAGGVGFTSIFVSNGLIG